MEFAMMDTLVHRCQERDIEKIHGYYYPTAKNAMVKELYGSLGFIKTSENEKGSTEWICNLKEKYKTQNFVIQVEE